MNIEIDNIERKVIKKLKTIKDLELPVNIYDLGLIYKTEVALVDENINVSIETTTIDSRANDTQAFSEEIIKYVKSIDEVDECRVSFVNTPKWDASMITALGQEQLGNANSKEV